MDVNVTAEEPDDIVAEGTYFWFVCGVTGMLVLILSLLMLLYIFRRSTKKMSEIVIMKQTEFTQDDEHMPEVFPMREGEDAMRVSAFLGKDHRTTEDLETKEISKNLSKIMSDADASQRFAYFMSAYNRRPKEDPSCALMV